MIHVLYVDDEPELPARVKAALEASGEIIADTAMSAQGALEMLGQQHYDAVVSGVRLPDRETEHFLEKIQATAPGLPVIGFFLGNKPVVSCDCRTYGCISEADSAIIAASPFDELQQYVLKIANRYRVSDHYRRIIENAREGIVVVQDGIIVFSNPALRKMLGGYPASEIEGNRFTRFIHYHDHEKLLRRVQERLWGNELDQEIVFRAISRNGSVLCLESKAIVIEWDGRPATLSFITDVTDRKQAEAALVVANHKISILNDLTRHDIANRLTVLRGRLKRTKKLARDPEVIRQLEEVEHAGREIFNYLETAHLYQDLGMLSPQWFSLHALVDCSAMQTEETDLKISRETGDLEIYTDPLCPHVFENLIDNSLRHGNHVSTIRISTRETEQGLVILLEDDGCGIPEPEKELIFEHGVGKHTGLGLFLSREILSVTGITIRETGNFGEGARFELTVPRGAYRHEGSRQAIGQPCT